MLKKLIDHLAGDTVKNIEEILFKKKVDSLIDVYKKILSEEKFLVRAIQFEAEFDINSEKLEEKLIGLKKMLHENSTVDIEDIIENPKKAFESLEDKVLEIIAQRTVEARIEQKLNEHIREKNQEYLRNIKNKIIDEETGADNEYTLKKLEKLNLLDGVHLSDSILDMLRPSSLDEVVGQEEAINSLLAKISSPFPQHVILYGPPGVGKTTVARLALKRAKELDFTPFNDEAPFIEVDGTVLRWDPREITNPLLGSVHDPIYQGAQKGYAADGVPEPKPGLVTDAHGGVLFIDEIGELDPALQRKLLKVLEDKRVQFDSAYYDPSHKNIPSYIRKLFDDGAPADFVLIGATTRMQGDISHAIRSRTAEVFFKPLGRKHIMTILKQASKKLNLILSDSTIDLISRYSSDGRKAVNILADIYGSVLYETSFNNDYDSKKPVHISYEHAKKVLSINKIPKIIPITGKNDKKIGRIYGLGVREYLGSLIEIEAIAFETSKKGEGKIRFNETAGKMAHDSVHNASSVIRKHFSINIFDYDLHINVIGGGNIDGPSAGVAITCAIASAILKKGIPQNIALTGEISLNGEIKPIGGVEEKYLAAKMADMKYFFLPADNFEAFEEVFEKDSNMEVIGVNKIEDVFFKIFSDDENELIDKSIINHIDTANSKGVI